MLNNDRDYLGTLKDCYLQDNVCLYFRSLGYSTIIVIEHDVNAKNTKQNIMNWNNVLRNCNIQQLCCNVIISYIRDPFPLNLCYVHYLFRSFLYDNFAREMQT